MSVFMIPTFLVEVDFSVSESLLLRVPQTELDAVTRVLNFNRRTYSVKAEESFLGQQFDLSVKGNADRG